MHTGNKLHNSPPGIRPTGMFMPGLPMRVGTTGSEAVRLAVRLNRLTNEAGAQLSRRHAERHGSSAMPSTCPGD